MTTANYSPARLAHVAALAARAGSHAKTLRGQLRAILAHAAAIRPGYGGAWLLADVPALVRPALGQDQARRVM
jgi:hypothetical protein